MEFVDRLTRSASGALAVLAVAAFLEAFGDSLFQTAFSRSIFFFFFTV